MAIEARAVRACPLGCAEPGTSYGTLENTVGYAFSRKGYDLACCGGCKLVYLSPAPTDADLRALYVENGQFGEEYTDPKRVEAILEYMGQSFDRLASGDRGWDLAGGLRILEVGAGLAWMCRAAKLRSAQHRTVAQDVSPEAVTACPWVDKYVQGHVSDRAIDPYAPFQVISMTHVIEHLVDPRAVLRECRARLAPNGVIFITAPHRPREWREGDLDAWRRYSYNHVPAHIQYFSLGSMQKLAASVDCELAHWSHDHEGGEAFEAWLTPRPPLWQRLKRRFDQRVAAKSSGQPPR